MSTTIHPTAIIDPRASIGDGCEIGPYCIVGADVELGAHCWLQHHVSLNGPSKFGWGNRFHAFCSIGQQTQDLKYAGEPTHLEVGDENCFREFATVHRGTAPGSKTTIGNRGNFLAYAHIAHDCTVGSGVIFSNNGTIAGHVEVGDCAIIGGLTAIHQFCRIGAYALTGGCSKIVQDVPPYMIADGNPAEVRSFNKVGLERHGFSEEAIRRVKEAYRLIYRAGLNVQQAMEQIRNEWPDTPELALLVGFVTSSTRGIVK
ncbi:MAG TPA: acyl-ACP--UDP-N-acetylglucosamine O-acyltransferase [Chthoniobacteraceae bacterium]|jgi:UDP-N-acetylglucosamine acyltransferase|nr:Acyl-[acyl-carrier-protein]--UDP-N-acetylglucosamine O-acyltransferase [Chthoniobacter sp.]HEV7866374.1 acyl-ACP--UDP-N-acetylglucosamine O-acyltransferase [Chthoniobacteraceae bacterium]